MIVVLTAGRLVVQDYHALISLSRALSAYNRYTVVVPWMIKTSTANMLKDGFRRSWPFNESVHYLICCKMPNRKLAFWNKYILAYKIQSNYFFYWLGEVLHCARLFCTYVCKVNLPLSRVLWGLEHICDDRGKRKHSKKTHMWVCAESP